MTKSDLDNLELKKYLTIKDIENFSELLDIGKLLKINNPRQIIFHKKNSLDQIPNCLCGTPLKWNNDKRSYRLFCSNKCSATHSIQKRKQTSLEKYGVDHFSKTEEFQNKIKQTSLERYGVEHYSKTEKFQKSVKETNLKKYGVEYPAMDANIVEKTKNIFLEKYGVDNPSKSKKITEKISNTNLEKYGYSCVFESPNIKEKIKKTNIEKYGCDNPRKNQKISDKISITKRQNLYSQETLEKLYDVEWIKSENQNGKSIAEIAKQIGISSDALCKYLSKNSVEIKLHHSSSQERTIIEFLEKFNIEYIKNDRKTIFPRELDIVIPKFSLAIEINGGFWHHEDAGKDKNYHFQKYLLCREKNIELWNIFDWEINNNLELILAKIQHKIKLAKRIYARNLSVQLVNDLQKKKFVTENHLQGDCPSKINLGLFDKFGKLFSLMTFGRSRFNKQYTWELLRYCSLKDYAVVGGAGKLINFFKKNYLSLNESLVSYCNLRYSNGDLYQKIGFQEIGISPPNYFYVTRNGQYAGSRNQWQKHMLSSKLPIYDTNKTEKENMNDNGYHRIWDCGNKIFRLD
jgi:hypothetical protein